MLLMLKIFLLLARKSNWVPFPVIREKKSMNWGDMDKSDKAELWLEGREM